MDDQNLLRYSRQIMLPEIEFAGQEILGNSHIMIVGLGGLGSPAAMYLASAGVGHITLVDFDYVDLSNLQRQIIHQNEQIGSLKVESAKATLQKLNPNIRISCLSKKMTVAELSPHLNSVALLLDCSDNFETRYALNDLALQHSIPLISGAAIGLEGQISVFDFRDNQSPCYRCLYSEGEAQDLSCAENGVLGPLVGIIGSLQALEACKVLVGFGESLCGRLMVFDGKYSEWRSLKLKRDPDCKSCGRR